MLSELSENIMTLRDKNMILQPLVSLLDSVTLTTHLNIVWCIFILPHFCTVIFLSVFLEDALDSFSSAEKIPPLIRSNTYSKKDRAQEGEER